MYRIRSEWTLREMELPPELLTSRKALVRWVAMALGLLSPNDGREGALYVLEAVFEYEFGRGRAPSFEDIYSFVSRRFLERGRKAPTEEAVRHHLRRMMRMGVVERVGGAYRLTRNLLRPDDPAGFVDTVFERLGSVRKLLREAVSNLYSLYRM